MGKMQIKLTSARPLNIAEAVEQKGIGFGKLDNGEFGFTLSFPGVAPVDLTAEDLARILETVDRVEPEGSGPGAVFQRSATVDNDGTLQARFSDAPRARAVKIAPEDRVPLANLLGVLLDRHAEFEAQFRASRIQAEDPENAENAAE